MGLIEISPKQRKFLFESTARINIAEGAVRSGKSFIILHRFMQELMNGPEGEYVVTGKSRDTLERNVITPLQNMCSYEIPYNRGYGYFHLSGKKVYVIGANDERASSKIKGATFAGALVDEVTELPESYFEMLFSRLTIKGSKLFGGTNPDSPYHWLKTNYIDRFKEEDPRFFKRFKFILDDNPSLDAEIKSDLERKYQGLWYKRFILGEWVLAEGAVYDFFDSSLHVVDHAPTYAKNYFLGIDYGTSNAFAAVLVGYNDNQKPEIWVEKEYYWDSKKMGFQKTNADYANDLNREFGGYPVRMAYLDPSAASFQTELRRQKIPVTQANNEVLDGIRCISTLLSERSLVICKNCTNLIKEIEGYVWDDKAVKRGEDKPMKQRDHAIDALRYVIFSYFGKKTTLKETNYGEMKQQKWNQNPMNNQGFGPNSWGWQKY